VDEGGEDRRRAPEKSVLHEAFRRGWPEVSSSMPTRVKREVERFLTCGDVRAGFVQVSCVELRRVSAGGLQLQRPWVVPVVHHPTRARHGRAPGVAAAARGASARTLSLPFAVRFLVVKKPKLLKRLEVRLVKAVGRWQRREARRHGATGALTARWYRWLRPMTKTWPEFWLAC